jgi:hypothetical protein
VRGLHGGDVASCGSARRWAAGKHGCCGCDAGYVDAMHGARAPDGWRFGDETQSQRAGYHLRLPPPNCLGPDQMNRPNVRRSTRCEHGDGNAHDGQPSADGRACMEGLEDGHELGGHSGHAHWAHSCRCWLISRLRTRRTTTTSHSWLTCGQL